MSPSTYKLFEGRGVWWRFAELSGRPTSLVYRVPVIAPNQRRTHQFTLPGRINSEFTAFRGGKDLCFHPSHSGSSDCHQREYLPASQRQTHLHATCTAGRTRRGTDAGPGDAAFLIMSLYLPPSPSNLREKQLSEKIWKWARRVPGRDTVASTFRKLHGRSRSVSTAAKKNNIQRPVLGRTVAGPQFAGGEHLFFPWDRLSLDPSPILRSTLRVFRLLFMFTGVVHCTTTEIGCNWQQLRREGIIAPFTVCLSASAYIRNA